MKPIPYRYDVDTRADAIDMVVDDGLTQAQVAAHTGISYMTIHKWIGEYREAGRAIDRYLAQTNRRSHGNANSLPA